MTDPSEAPVDRPEARDSGGSALDEPVVAADPPLGVDHEEFESDPATEPSSVETISHLSLTTSEPLGIVAAPELVFARGAESLVGVGDANVELWVAPNPESAEVGTEANGLLEVAALDH